MGIGGVKYLPTDGGGFLVIMRGSADVHDSDTVVNATIQALNCPYGLLSDSETVISELVDAVQAGYMLIAYRLRKPITDPIKLGLSHMDYEAHYSRPVLVWLAHEDGKTIRLARLLKPCWIGGFKCRACQASALVINSVLNKLGLSNIMVR